jgi:glutaminyl-tRNA synthetase
VRNFAERVGIARRDQVIDVSLLEFCVREDLNKSTTRVMGVINPLKITITNYPEGQTEWLDAINNPEDESMGTRKVPFSREILIEQDDFMEEAPKKYFRLAPGQEVRLRYAYFIKCEEIVKDANGKIIEVKCKYDPATKGGNAPDGRKVKGTIHWVSAPNAIKAEARLYDRLFVKENPEDPNEDCDFKVNLNPNSLLVQDCYVEPFLKDAKAMDKFQFERIGYFCADYDSKPGALVFNRTVTLKDSWSKISGKE